MKTKCLTLILAAGMLAALPAYSFPWFNKATYDSRLGYKPQPAATTTASAQGKSELQVAVMANAPAQPNAKPSGADMWYGTDQHARATHSH
jgi:hypothetical protein